MTLCFNLKWDEQQCRYETSTVEESGCQGQSNTSHDSTKYLMAECHDLSEQWIIVQCTFIKKNKKQNLWVNVNFFACKTSVCKL